jgi:hypothetical protein
MRIREALDTRDRYTSQARKQFSDQVSQFASHVTYRGFQMTAQGGLGQIGPFIDEAKLQAWLEENSVDALAANHVLWPHADTQRNPSDDEEDRR